MCKGLIHAPSFCGRITNLQPFVTCKGNGRHMMFPGCLYFFFEIFSPVYEIWEITVRSADEETGLATESGWNVSP
jgi:hypothetical protein